MFVTILAFIHVNVPPLESNSYDERTMNARWTHKRPKAYVRQPSISCVSQECFTISLQRSYGSLANSHDYLTAVLRQPRKYCVFLFLLSMCEHPTTCACIVQLPYDVYDMIWPVWTFAKLSAICLRRSAPAKSYDKIECTIDVKQALTLIYFLSIMLKPVSHQPQGVVNNTARLPYE